MELNPEQRFCPEEKEDSFLSQAQGLCVVGGQKLLLYIFLPKGEEAVHMQFYSWLDFPKTESKAKREGGQLNFEV